MAETFEAGRLVRIHGVKGALVLRLDRTIIEVEDFPEWIFLMIDGGLVPFRISEESVYQKDGRHLVIALDQAGTRKQAEELIGYACHMEGTWEDWFEIEGVDDQSIIGFTVLDIQSGKSGIVSGFEEIPGNPLIEVNLEGKQILVPYREEYVLQEDRKTRRLILDIPEGLRKL
jgi:16S rRNA processing protein RimM